MKRQALGRCLKASALAIDVGAPLVATATQFQIWVERSSSATVSGLFLFFAFLSAIPFWRQIKEWIKSPSAPLLWTFLAIFFVALRNIVDEMLLVSVVGAVSNCIGACVYKCGALLAGRKEERGE